MLLVADTGVECYCSCVFYKMLLLLVVDAADHYLYDYYYMALVLAIIQYYVGVRGIDFVMRLICFCKKQNKSGIEKLDEMAAHTSIQL